MFGPHNSGNDDPIDPMDDPVNFNDVKHYLDAVKDLPTSAQDKESDLGPSLPSLESYEAYEPYKGYQGYQGYEPNEGR